MANKYKYMHAIIIGGNFMKGVVYYPNKKEAYANLEKEVKEGYKKLKEYDEKHNYNRVYWTTDKNRLIGIDGCVGEHLACADDYEKFITYKVSRIRVPV